MISFPPGTEMFQFPGFASRTYGFSAGYRLRGGLPHSDIHGSKPARGSPWLFAACHVLLRLLTPRHPPNALLTLDPNHPSQPNSHSVATDAFSDHNPLHPFPKQNGRTHARTPAPPQKERIRQNPLHNVKQPKPGTKYPHVRFPPAASAIPKLLKQSNRCLRCDDLLSAPTARAARCLRGIGSGGAASVLYRSALGSRPHS